MALRRFRADFHIHTCLSPCGELTIYPSRVVERAKAEGLDLIAVSDHNTAENAAATLRAAKGTGLTVWPGMEITSEEEVHILGLFPSLKAVRPVQDDVFRTLPEIAAGDVSAEEQVIVNKDDEVMGYSRHRLMSATQLSVREVVDMIHRAGGLAFASHVDREAFSLVSQLGFIPPDLDLDALEISPLLPLAEARTIFAAYARLPLVRFSDAHRPEEIGRISTDFLMAGPVFDELRLALRAQNGRGVCLS